MKKTVNNWLVGLVSEFSHLHLGSSYNKNKNPSYSFRFNLALIERTPQGAYEEETYEKNRK